MITPRAVGRANSTAACIAVGLLILSATSAAEDIPPPPPMPEDASPETATPPAPKPPAARAAECQDCGVVRSIRSVERERSTQRGVPTYMTSEQYLQGRRYSEPMVGPVFGMTFGKGQETRSFVGAAGSETMRQRILEIHYEITVRFDDGRFGLFEQDALNGLRVGDRVHVADDRVEPAPK